MSPFGLYCLITMQNPSSHTDHQSSSSSSLLFLDSFLQKLCFNLISRTWCFFLHQESRKTSRTQDSGSSSNKNQENGFLLSREDVEIVMKRLGFSCSGRESDDDRDHHEEMIEVFAEEEPSLEEVKQAFDVFDLNKDGFADAEELQRVLYKLGLHDQGLENCREMVRSYDRNGDGKIDFDEFVVLMEKSFC